MKKLLLLLLLAGLFQAVIAQGLDSIIVERYYVSNADDSSGSVGLLPAGSVTYRIFVDMAPSCKLLTIYGDIDNPFHFTTTSAFFNNEDRGAKTPTYTKAQAKFNTVMLDSWVSIGAGCAANFGVLKSEDNGVATVVNADGILQNNDPLAGIPLSSQDGFLAGSPMSVTTLGIDNELEILNDVSQAGGLFTSTDGAWASLYGAKGPTSANRVLVGQFTTKGVFTFQFNVQIRDTVTNTVQLYVHTNQVTNEIVFPGLTYSSNLPPAVSISSPSNGATFLAGVTVPIQALTSDIDGTVKKVRFYIDGNLVETDSIIPFQYNYTAVYGNHVLICTAIDDFNDSTQSMPVQIGVGASSVQPSGSQKTGARFYPNPFTNQIRLEANPGRTAQFVTYRILDLLGRVIIEKNMGLKQDLVITEIELTGLPKGQYLMECRIGVNKFIQSVTKQ